MHVTLESRVVIDKLTIPAGTFKVTFTRNTQPQTIVLIRADIQTLNYQVIDTADNRRSLGITAT